MTATDVFTAQRQPMTLYSDSIFLTNGWIAAIARRVCGSVPGIDMLLTEPVDSKPSL